MRSRVTTAAGVLAAAAALAVTEGLAALLDLRESPVVSVAQSVIDLTPGPIAEAIIGVVGTRDKPLAVTSVVIAILLLGAVAGRLVGDAPSRGGRAGRRTDPAARPSRC